jgi:hypothetical protein
MYALLLILQTLWLKQFHGVQSAVDFSGQNVINGCGANKLVGFIKTKQLGWKRDTSQNRCAILQLRIRIASCEGYWHHR